MEDDMFVDKRSSGILCPIFSLSSMEGIGTMGKGAYDFVDFLVETKQTYWQVLPIGITSYGNSPYQSFSSFAGNPFFIDLELLKQESLLDQEDIDIDWGDPQYIDYNNIENCKYNILKKAFRNSLFTKEQEEEAYIQFPWLQDFGIFMSLKETYQGQSRRDWENNSIKSMLLEESSEYLNEEGRFHVFLQIKFYQQ